MVGIPIWVSPIFQGAKTTGEGELKESEQQEPSIPVANLEAVIRRPLLAADGRTPEGGDGRPPDISKEGKSFVVT